MIAPNYQSPMNANAQAVNKANIFDGLKQAASVKPNTGTATGDQAAKDFAKSQQFQAQAQAGRQADKQNAQMHGQMQQQKEQLTQRGRSTRMQWNQQQADQQAQGMRLASNMYTQQLGLNTQRQAMLLSLLQ